MVAPIQNVWGALEPRDFPTYSAGSWGPEAAAQLIAKDGRQWYTAPPPRERLVEPKAVPVVDDQFGAPS